jgi:NAD(P)-dependent dehydrogenase (short-subunit alcohol dehydrogenase family)
MYFEQLGFRFYRLTPVPCHWNGGFATARWLGIERIVRTNPLSRESQERIVKQMNQNHADTLRRYLMATDGINDTDGVTLLGIDAEGIDLRVMNERGRIDCLGNNAGIFPDPAPGSEASSIFQADLSTVRRGLETNTLGALRVCQALIPLMEGNGQVVNVSSGMGQLSEMNGCCPGYRLSKTALSAVTRILADELLAPVSRSTRSVRAGYAPTWAVRTRRFRWRKAHGASFGRRLFLTMVPAAASSATGSPLPGSWTGARCIHDHPRLARFRPAGWEKWGVV